MIAQSGAEIAPIIPSLEGAIDRQPLAFTDAAHHVLHVEQLRWAAF
jgi:hypothetical protein